MPNAPTEYIRIEKTKLGLETKFEYLVTGGLSWYEQEATRILGLKRLPQPTEESLACQIYPKSFNDLDKKGVNRTYYSGNCVVFLRVLRRLLSPDFISAFRSQKADDLLIHNYYHLMLHLLFDSLDLLNGYLVQVKKEAPAYPLGKNPLQHHMTLFHSTSQAIFGQASFHSFIDLEPDLAAANLRILIEIRMRRAFGVLGYVDRECKSFSPLPLGCIFEILKEYKQTIDFSVPLDIIYRIYSWANIFMHIGQKDYLWKHIFALDMLREFALGKSKSFNVFSGISVPKNILNEIRERLNATLPEGSEILSCREQALLVE